MKYLFAFCVWLLFTLMAVGIVVIFHIINPLVGFFIGIAFGGIGIGLGLGIGEMLFN